MEVLVELVVREEKNKDSERGRAAVVMGSSQVWQGTGFWSRHSQVRILPPQLPFWDEVVVACSCETPC